ncbi:MAG TPA: hypothetical protein VK673_19355 [Chthoniobacterales bacterium]|nr:hypothetical protein [Chthoniobacterales bacterium]
MVFFESNGGTARAEATVSEIRLSVGHPDLDLGNIETALDALTGKGYYFTVERKNYKFSLKENLNKRFADKRRKTRNWTRLIKTSLKCVFHALRKCSVASEKWPGGGIEPRGGLLPVLRS